MTTGDSLSVRTKFCFLTWIGEKGGPLAKARAGPNKRILQQVITNFAWEGTFSDLRELDLKSIESEVRRAGGANYDAQAWVILMTHYLKCLTHMLWLVYDDESFQVIIFESYLSHLKINDHCVVCILQTTPNHRRLLFMSHRSLSCD